MVGLLLYPWLLVSSTGFWDRLDPERYQVFSLEGIDSPTSLLYLGDRFYVGADLMEPRPGIYRLLAPRDGRIRGVLTAYLPQQAVESIFQGPAGSLRVVSSRWFTPRKEDWGNQLLTLEPTRFQQVERVAVGIGNRCRDGTFGCGLTGMIPLEGETWLGVTRAGPAELSLLVLQEGVWQPIRTLPIKVNHKYATVSELKRRGDELLFLLQDRRMIAGISRTELLNARGTSVSLTPLFEFPLLKRQFRISNAALGYRGLAEGFEFDPQGNLYLLLNNRGYSFTKKPEAVPETRPLLLRFSVKEDEAKENTVKEE